MDEIERGWVAARPVGEISGLHCMHYAGQGTVFWACWSELSLPINVHHVCRGSQAAFVKLVLSLSLSLSLSLPLFLFLLPLIPLFLLSFSHSLCSISAVALSPVVCLKLLRMLLAHVPLILVILPQLDLLFLSIYHRRTKTPCHVSILWNLVM